MGSDFLLPVPNLVRAKKIKSMEEKRRKKKKKKKKDNASCANVLQTLVSSWKTHKRFKRTLIYNGNEKMCELSG